MDGAKNIVRFTCGRFLCRKVRDYLKEAQFNGYKFEWVESGGFLSHDFILKSEDDSALKIESDIKQQCQEIGVLSN